MPQVHKYSLVSGFNERRSEDRVESDQEDAEVLRAKHKARQAMAKDRESCAKQEIEVERFAKSVKSSSSESFKTEIAKHATHIEWLLGSR